ncbi:hypothetical protein [Puniceibacterium confluentis]|uniref:hypothetical protein n=1 Tax=Puniceibacterium confluentis TaxID=1958944 RepID=UPI0016446E3A|nr:hypothetical protein [Puniceibacterium confluentis]
MGEFKLWTARFLRTPFKAALNELEFVADLDAYVDAIDTVLSASGGETEGQVFIGPQEAQTRVAGESSALPAGSETVDISQRSDAPSSGSGGMQGNV